MSWQWEIPRAAVRRISKYVTVLRRLEDAGENTTFSSEIAELANASSAQVRKDLSYFGEFGDRGVGYPVRKLRQALLEVLGLDKQRDVIVVGAGNLGAALAGYPGFQQYGLRITAIFDNDPQKVGARLHGYEIRPLRELKSFVSEREVQLAIIAVPASSGQSVTDMLVEAGIRCILNFAPVQVSTPDHVLVNMIDMTSELGLLSFHLCHLDESNSD